MTSDGTIQVCVELASWIEPIKLKVSVVALAGGATRREMLKTSPRVIASDAFILNMRKDCVINESM